MTDGKRFIAFVAVLALSVVAAYLPAIHSGWVWDDVDLVQPSPALLDLGGLGRAMSTDLYRQANPRLEPSPYWRPLALASYWLDTRFGSPPRALHAGNVLLHALATALLGLVLVRRSEPIARRTRHRLRRVVAVAPPALAAIWWALHPENVETVAWISCRYDLLCGIAVLGLLAVPWGPGAGRAAVHGLLFLVGLLSKDGFAPMIAVVVAMDWAEHRALRAAAPRWIAMGLALVVWWVARAALSVPGFGLASPAALIPHFLEAARIYFARALLPPPLTTSHPYAPGTLGIATGAVVVLGLSAVVVRRRHLAVPVAVFLAGLVPAAVSMPKHGVASERYFYLPSIGLAFLVCELVGECLASKRLAARVVPVAVGLTTAVGLVRLEARLPEWKSDSVLFAAALRGNPEDSQANLQGGIEAGTRGDWTEARRMLEIAQTSDPRSGRIASAYAWALLHSGDAAGAARQAKRATELVPYLPDAWFYLARALHLGEDHAGELSALDKLLQISPEYPGALGARIIAGCEVRLEGGDVAGATEQAERLTERAPFLPEAWSTLAFARHLGGNHAGELSAIDALLRISPDFPGAGRVRAIAACEVSGRTDCVAAAGENAARR